jgi:hypothetical protein
MILRDQTARWGLVVSLTVICGFGIWLYWRWHVEPLHPQQALLPRIEIERSGRTIVRYANSVFITRVATFRDELFSYLMYGHYQKSALFRADTLLLSFADQGDAPQYRIDLVLSDNFIASVDRATRLDAVGSIEKLQWRLTTTGLIDNYRRQTRLFEAAYNMPVQRKMENLSNRELRNLLRRFIRFKSTTDPRIRNRIEPVPKALAQEEAQRLGGDIIDVARFYDLPLDLFLGIGAMENNYMDVRGDLSNSIWKQRAAKDDIVLDRRKGRVRVLNDSAGRWQITRETLRYVHQLYLKDKRDYSRLASHLRPASELDLNKVDPDSLTTYAGLLLRELLDHFNGDAALAVGAYNGGPGNPNMRYEGGVRTVAAHARSILERAAALNGESVMKMRWITAR